MALLEQPPRREPLIIQPVAHALRQPDQDQSLRQLQLNCALLAVAQNELVTDLRYDFRVVGRAEIIVLSRFPSRCLLKIIIRCKGRSFLQQQLELFCADFVEAVVVEQDVQRVLLERDFVRVLRLEDQVLGQGLHARRQTLVKRLAAPRLLLLHHDLRVQF